MARRHRLRPAQQISGRTYRAYAFPGTLVLDDGIPAQYERAAEEDGDIKTVVMTAGGNDILASQCDGACEPVVDDIAARLKVSGTRWVRTECVTS